MNTIPLRTVLRLLRIAMGYGSRTERIHRMLNSDDPDVQIHARSLAAYGFIREDLGTVYYKLPEERGDKLR